MSDQVMREVERDERPVRRPFTGEHRRGGLAHVWLLVDGTLPDGFHETPTAAEFTAAALRYSFLIEGAYDGHGTLVTQSPNQVAVDGNTVTLTLGTTVRAGHEVTVTYWGATLHDTDGTAVAAFTTTLTTTSKE